MEHHHFLEEQQTLDMMGRCQHGLCGQHAVIICLIIIRITMNELREASQVSSEDKCQLSNKSIVCCVTQPSIKPVNHCVATAGRLGADVPVPSTRGVDEG